MLRCFDCDSEAVMPKSGVCLACGYVSAPPRKEGVDLISSNDKPNLDESVLLEIEQSRKYVAATDSEKNKYSELVDTAKVGDESIASSVDSDSETSELSEFVQQWKPINSTVDVSSQKDNVLEKVEVVMPPLSTPAPIEKLVIEKSAKVAKKENIFSRLSNIATDEKETIVVNKVADSKPFQEPYSSSTVTNSALLSPTLSISIQIPAEGKEAARLNQLYKKLVNSCSSGLEKLKSGLVVGDGNEHRSFMVTSAKRGEGATVSSLAVAVALSRFGGAKVLLIDSNAVNPKLQTLFSLKNCLGFSDYIRQDADELLAAENNASAGSIFNALEKINDEADLAWARCSHYTEFKGLFVMPYSLKGSESLWDLVEHKAFSERINELKEIFDYVVFDSSAVMGASEATILSQYVDGVVMVVSGESTKWEVSEIAANLIRQAGGTLIGGILNRRKYYIHKSLYKWL